MSSRFFSASYLVLHPTIFFGRPAGPAGWLGPSHVQIPKILLTRPGKRLQKTMERSTMLFMGKSTISMAIFNSKLLNYQRVYRFYLFQLFAKEIIKMIINQLVCLKMAYPIPPKTYLCRNTWRPERNSYKKNWR